MDESSSANTKCKRDSFVIQGIFLLVTTSIDTVTKVFLCLLHEVPLLQFWWLQWHHRCLVNWLSRCKFGFIWLSKLRKQRKCSSKVHTLPLKASIHYCDSHKTSIHHCGSPQKNLSIIVAPSKASIHYYGSPQSIYPLLWLPQKHLSIIAAFSAQNQVWMTTEQPKRK